MSKSTKALRLKFSWGKKAAAQDDELLDDLKSTLDSTDIIDTDVVYDDIPKHRKKYLSGWRLSVILCIVLVSSIFVLNVGVTIWVLRNRTVVQGVATVYEGSCAKTKNYTTFIHLRINLLGSCLLGASNFCMQILCAPTREEIDTAHAKCRWLRIGVASLKNLLYVDRRKTLLWVTLGLSSIPLHLLWNSAVMDSLSSNSYIHAAATRNFLEGAPLHSSLKVVEKEYEEYMQEVQTMRDKYNNNSLVVMDPQDCIKAYGQTFISTYGNVILVYDNLEGNTSLLDLYVHEGFRAMYGGVESQSFNDPGDHWICGNDNGCDLSRLSQKNGSHWNPWANFDISSGLGQGGLYFEGNVKHCLTEKANNPCRLGMSPPILITVLACNALKLISFIILLWIAGPGSPLVTNGDAIESFLLRPDQDLKGRCLASQLDVRRDDDVRREKSFWSRRTLPVEWKARRRHWAVGASKGFWMSTLFPYVSGIK